MSAMDVDMARKRREQLNAYADAMNRRRGPLGYSLHDVLGHDRPAARCAGRPGDRHRARSDLTVEAFGEIRGYRAEAIRGVAPG